jgi:hypothetical protein
MRVWLLRLTAPGFFTESSQAAWKGGSTISACVSSKSSLGRETMSRLHEVSEDANHGWLINPDRITHVQWKKSQDRKPGDADLRVTLFFGDSKPALKLKGETAAKLLKMLKEQR